MGEAITGATNTRIDTQMANTEVIRRYPRESDPDFGRLLGKEVNHGSIVWYVFDLVAPKFA